MLEAATAHGEAEPSQEDGEGESRGVLEGSRQGELSPREHFPAPGAIVQSSSLALLVRTSCQPPTLPYTSLSILAWVAPTLFPKLVSPLPPKQGMLKEPLTFHSTDESPEISRDTRRKVRYQEERTE